MRLPRVAVLVPSSDTTVEEELPQLLAGRATVHFTRMGLPDVTPEGLAIMEDNALVAARLLADIAPDVVLFACTSGSFFRGAVHERAMAQTLADAAGASVVTTAWAVSLALLARGTSVRIRTPYTAELTEAEGVYMRAAGLTIASAEGLGITRDADIAAVEPTTLLAHVEGVDAADVLLASCTNLRTLGLLAALQQRSGMPVVTSNSASAEAVIGVLSGRIAALATPS